jgi:hypothetical protein
MEAAGVLPSSTSDASPKQALLSLLTINGMHGKFILFINSDVNPPVRPSLILHLECTDVYEFETIDGIGGFGPTTTWLHRERSRATRKVQSSLLRHTTPVLTCWRLRLVTTGWTLAVLRVRRLHVGISSGQRSQGCAHGASLQRDGRRLWYDRPRVTHTVVLDL